MYLSIFGLMVPITICTLLFIRTRKYGFIILVPANLYWVVAFAMDLAGHPMSLELTSQMSRISVYVGTLGWLVLAVEFLGRRETRSDVHREDA